MKTKTQIFKNGMWLLLGLLFSFFSGGDQPVWLAVWLAPIFIVRFFHETGAFRAYLICLPCMVVVYLIANKGMVPFPSFKTQLIVASVSTAFALLPYVLDKILGRSLPSAIRIFILPSMAIAIPFLRSSYGTWFHKANAIDDLALLQLISVTGVSGISFLILWTAAMVNEIWEQKNYLVRVRKLTAALMIVLMLVYGFGFIRLRSDYKPKNSILVAGIVREPSLRDKLMEAITGIFHSDPQKPSEIENIRNSMNMLFDKMLSDSIAMAKSGFKIAVWPEGAVLLFEDDENSKLQLAAEKAKESDICLGISLVVYQNKSIKKRPGIQPILKNKLVLISSKGDMEWEYSKSLLAPGMEAAVMIPGDRVMKAGREDDINITGAICYEMDFPYYIRQVGKLNANLLLAPSNDWAEIKNIHSRMARLRAIENGISLFRPVRGGISIAVDPYGRILSQADNFYCNGAPFTAVIPIGPVATIYKALGDYFNWICVIISLACVALSIIFRFK